ncbi:hypothetical protein K439DRAFT_1350615, partial [Ramaria rubella]
CDGDRVCNKFTVCGHSYDLPEEMIQCDSRWCKFSSTHPQDCSGPECKRTCWQYRQYPQVYAPQINNICPACRDVEAHNSRRRR